MKTKQLVCSDCGCRFEIKDAKESAPQAPGIEKPHEGPTKPATVSCPQCGSYNLTTA